MGFLPEPDSLVDDKFHVDYEIRSGPMGTIFAATDQYLGRRVALKFLNPNLAKNSEWCERFQREARASALLTSVHATRIHDVEVLRNGLPYIVMELLSGRGLDVTISQTGAQPIAESAHYILQTCHALGEAHASGIVHRDLKPENLFVDDRSPETPILKVLDFGIAKLMLDWALKSRLTQPRQLLGTPPYMAPEQWRDCATVDHRVDIWSLGVILYELLTGRLPFPTSTSVLLQEMIECEPPKCPSILRENIPDALCDVVMKCLCKNPSDRYQNVGELALAISPYCPMFGDRLARETIAFLKGPPKTIETPSERFSIRPMNRPIAHERADTLAYLGNGGVGRREWYEQIKFVPQSFLTKAVCSRVRRRRRVTFVVGSALTAPYREYGGVPNTKGILEIVRSKVPMRDLDEFNDEVGKAHNQYQAAMKYLLQTDGADAVNDVIRQAVLAARLAEPPKPAFSGERRACISLERDVEGWSISPGLNSLGQLVASYPQIFGDTILTSNFDPLIEISIARAGGKLLRTVLHGDGELQRDEDEGCNVVHFHGDWFRSDTLHAPLQLGHWRPKLSTSIDKLLRESTIVVMGYGGWDDVFTTSLVNAVAGGAHNLDVLWAFHSDDESRILRKYARLFDAIREALVLGRVLLHSNVEIHSFLSELRERIDGELERAATLQESVASSPAPRHSLVVERTETPAEPRHFDTLASSLVEERETVVSGKPTKIGLGGASNKE